MIVTLLRACLKLGVASLLLAIIAGWFQELHPAFDSFSHFRLVFCTIAVPVVLVLLLGRAFVWAGVITLVVVISLYLTTPYLTNFGPLHTPAPPENELRVVQMNLRFNNPTPQKAVAAIRPGRADVILLQEVTHLTQGVMTAFLDTYPHQISCQIRGVGSVAILSRFNFLENRPDNCARFFGFAHARIRFKGQIITLANFHSRWPWPRRQEEHIDRLEPRFRMLGSPLILAGDFNAAPWSAAVKRVATLTKTVIAEGLVLSWAPRLTELKLSVGPLLPIDQTLVSPSLKVVSRTIMEEGGSDHFPILTILDIRK